MEILSTGEKIKRDRIYKGITLKELCNDKISISKMSCIENGKVKAEPWILEEVSKKLDLDIEYLKQDVKEQIEINIERLKKIPTDKLSEKDIIYSLDYALEDKLYKLAFELMHILFAFYLSTENYDGIQINISQYHIFLQKAWSEEALLLYSNDIANYFYKTKEYTEALVYYNKIMKSLKEKNIGSKKDLALATYNVADTNFMLNEREIALELLESNEKLLEFLPSDIHRGRAWELQAILLISKDKEKYEILEKKVLSIYEDSLEDKARFYLRIGNALLEEIELDAAIKYIDQGIDMILQGAKDSTVEYLLHPLEKLLEAKYYDYGEKICETLLEKAIKSDNIKLIEKSYYFKSLIFKNQGSFSQAEMYMNLSLDALLKFAGKSDRYDRYLDMANMYYDMGEYNDSIKYFTLALGEEKKM